VLCRARFLGNSYDLGEDGLEMQVHREQRSFRSAEEAVRALGTAANEDQCTGLCGMDSEGNQNEWRATTAALQAKFRSSSPLERALLDTGDAFLLCHASEAGRGGEWSDCGNGTGANWLGLQLMLLRDRKTGWKRWTEFIEQSVDRQTGRPLYGIRENAWQEAVRNAQAALAEALAREQEEDQPQEMEVTENDLLLTSSRREEAEQKQLEQPKPMQQERQRHSAPSGYFEKFAGAGMDGPSPPPLTQTAFSFVGSFLGIAALGLMHTYLMPQVVSDIPLEIFIGSFGATAVLLFSAHELPVAQPKNAVIGTAIGGLAGVTLVELMPGGPLWLSAALVVSLTIVAQELAATSHPPGVATALVYVLTEKLQRLQYVYVLCPALAGTVVLVLLGILVNNLSPARTYPQLWWCREGMERAKPACSSMGGPIRQYFTKFGGAGAAGQPRQPLGQAGLSLLGSFAGLAALGLAQERLLPLVAPTLMQQQLLVAAFGDTASLVFGTTESPLGQPKNVILGSTIGGFVGVLVVKIMEMLGLADMLWLSGALAVSLTVVAQELTTSVHSAGGALALIFVVRTCGPEAPLQHSAAISAIGDRYALCPAFMGASLFVVLGLIFNNMSSARVYPQRWW